MKPAVPDRDSDEDEPASPPPLPHSKRVKVEDSVSGSEGPGGAAPHLSEEDLLSDYAGVDLEAFGNDGASFLKASTLEVMQKTHKLEDPPSSFAVNSYQAALTPGHKLENHGFAHADADSSYRLRFQYMLATSHRYKGAAAEALRMMKRSHIAPERRMEAEMARIRESEGPDAEAYVQLNNLFQRLQREDKSPAKKHAQTLATVIGWKLKSLFADGDFDFDKTDPIVTVDAAYVRALISDPPKAPRKRKLETRGPRPSGKRKEKDACAEDSVDLPSSDE